MTLAMEECFSHFAHHHDAPVGDAPPAKELVDLAELQPHDNQIPEQENPSTKAFVKSVVMEISVAVHSIIIGFGLGSLGSADVTTIRVLLVALSFHQFFEGISLGTAISETKLHTYTKLAFGGFFAVTLPVGIVIGILTQATTTGNTVKGAADAIAAGSLIYSCLVEMVAESFQDPSLRHKRGLKLLMILFFSLGCASLCILAIWA